MTRRELYRWAGWFGAANAGLYLLVALRYLPGLVLAGLRRTAPPLYVPLAMVGQMALLAIVLPFLVLGPLIAVWPVAPRGHAGGRAASRRWASCCWCSTPTSSSSGAFT